MSQTSVKEQRSPETTDELDVELRKVFKVFNGETAVRGVDLDIHRGEFFSILGPSGCGKTTTLRLMAGFETPSAGEVLIQGQSMNHVPPYRRPVNTVFQSYALFSHLNVWENIAFGLRIKKLSKAEIADRVQEALKLVKMESYTNRYPGQMSGGQQQRVALARALVNRPAVILLDEPLGALDLKLRKQMQVELSNLHQDLGLTFVMVTHDQEEALSLSDRIAVMRGGKVEQIGSPSEIYECPRTPFVADFIGDTNLFEGRIEASDYSTINIVTNSGQKIVVQPPEPWNTSGTHQEVVVSVRPEKIQLSLYPPASLGNCFEGRLKHMMYMGTHVHYVVELLSGDCLTVRQPNTVGAEVALNTPVYAHWSTTDCLAMNAVIKN
ncbi:ABC transporter ATP-binding protein [Cyanobacteria bacterium FACHB-472]|nr:ABC transporter ATP-binding protein [Cyanobacteria bacterium FACHB-472]